MQLSHLLRTSRFYRYLLLSHFVLSLRDLFRDLVDFREGDGVNVVSQIANRRVLWTSPDLDVTDMIVEYMNARFDAMAVR